MPSVVPLQTERTFEICRRLALKHPEGPLFRNSDGNPWTAFVRPRAGGRLALDAGAGKPLAQRLFDVLPPVGGVNG